MAKSLLDSVVYTPTEGDAIQNFSRLFRKPEGCFLNIHAVDRVEHDLALWGRPEDVDYIVVTGEIGHGPPFHVYQLIASRRL